MSRRQPDLSVDGIRIPLAVGGEATQAYEQFGGFALVRMADGAVVHQETWRKLRTTISASGAVPVGLDALDWRGSHVIGCIAARSIQSIGNAITIPSARRVDAPPYGFAITPGGLLQPTAVVLAGDVATLAAVGGAVGYQVLWYPLLTVHAPAGPAVSYDAAGAVAAWELICEEV